MKPRCCPEHRVHLLMHERHSVGDILRFLSPILVALSDVTSDLNVRPCDQQDREDLCLLQIANAHWWRRMMEMRKPHAPPILPGSTVPCDVRSDLNLWLFPQRERRAFVVLFELFDLLPASLTYIQVTYFSSHCDTGLYLFGTDWLNCF